MRTLGKCFISVVMAGAIVVITEMVTNMMIEMKSEKSEREY